MGDFMFWVDYQQPRFYLSAGTSYATNLMFSVNHKVLPALYPSAGLRYATNLMFPVNNNELRPSTQRWSQVRDWTHIFGGLEGPCNPAVSGIQLALCIGWTPRYLRPSNPKYTTRIRDQLLGLGLNLRRSGPSITKPWRRSLIHVRLYIFFEPVHE